MNYWQLRKRGLSRRRFMYGAAAASVGAGALLTVGCGDDDDDGEAAPDVSPTAAPSGTAEGSPEATSSAGQAKRGGTLRYAGPINKLTMLDPHQHNGAEVTTPGGLTYLTLLRTGPQSEGNEIHPGMIESWERPDDTTMVLKLRQGIRMQNVDPVNGRDVTTDDVIYGLERIRTDRPSFYLRSLFTPLTTIEATDATTVTLKTAEPYASLPAWLALAHSVMIPQEMDEAYPDGLGGAGAGAGPFILENFDFEGGAKFVRNPDYFEGEPLLDGIEMAAISDANAHYAAVVAKNVDLSSPSSGTYLTKRQYDELKSKNPDDYHFEEWPFPSWTSVRFNVSKPPFNDPRVRQALALATDRNAYTQLGWEGGLIPMGPLSAALPNWAIPQDELAQLPGYRSPKDEDIAEAKRLLEAAGATGLSFTLGAYNTYEAAGQALTGMWRENLDIDVKIELPADYTAIIDTLNSGNFEAFHMFHSGYLDPDDYFVSHHMKGGARNYGKIDDPQVDDMTMKVRQTIDEVQRKAYSDELQQYLLDQSYFVYLGNPVDYFAHNPKVQGWFHEAVTNGEWRWAAGWGFAE